MQITKQQLTAIIDFSQILEGAILAHNNDVDAFAEQDQVAELIRNAAGAIDELIRALDGVLDQGISMDDVRAAEQAWFASQVVNNMPWAVGDNR